MAKERLTIAQEIARTKFKIANPFIWAIYRFLVWTPIFGAKYHGTYTIKDDINDCKGPCFLLFNHLSRRDFYFLVKLCKKRRFNIVCQYSEFFRKKFKTPFKLVQVLPKKNFTDDIVGMKAMASIIKQGGCLAFSPEGMSSIYGHNQPIVAGTGKFLKYFRIPVYFAKIEGAYLTSHKVSIGDRIGKIRATLSLMFSPERLKEMSEQEIEDEINLAFKHDDYAWNKTARIKYKTKGKTCDHLHDLLYRCPKCGKEFTIVSEGNQIKCTNCGNGATIDDYYDVHPFDDSCVVPVSPSKWFDDQRRVIIKEIREDENYSFSFDTKVGELPTYEYIKDKTKSSINCGSGKITLDHQGIHFKGIKHDEPFSFDLSYEKVFSLIITNDCTNFSFYVNNEYYEFEPTTPVTGKVLLLVEEMHRLHFNTWKNFPWDKDMYPEGEVK